MSVDVFHLAVPLRERWEHIELLRMSLLNCLHTLFRDNDFCQEVAVIAGELLENAMKYGDWSKADDASFRLRVHGNAEAVSVEVTNPVSCEASAHEAIRTTHWIHSFESAQAAYLTRLKEVADQPLEDDTSRLGLVRIAYQAGCQLSAELHRDQRLTVRAVSRAPGP